MIKKPDTYDLEVLLSFTVLPWLTFPDANNPAPQQHALTSGFSVRLTVFHELSPKSKISLTLDSHFEY